MELGYKYTSHVVYVGPPHINDVTHTFLLLKLPNILVSCKRIYFHVSVL